jgi:hypothetical protein
MSYGWGVHDGAGGGRRHAAEGRARGWRGQRRTRRCTGPDRVICFVRLTGGLDRLRVSWPGR